MGNMHLVTGYAGQAHITSDDHASLNAAIVGSDQYVMERGNNLFASVISNNQVRILDGDIVMQGRHIRIPDNTYVDLTIENGSQGLLRNDLIVARYTKNSGTGVEDCNLVVIKGTAVASDPADPEYTIGRIFEDQAILNDMPLYRIPLDGINIQTPVPLFSTNTKIANAITMANNANAVAEEAKKAAQQAASATHASRHAKDGEDPLAPEAIGAVDEDSPYLWRTIELLPYTYGDGPNEFSKDTVGNSGTVEYVTKQLPVPIETHKYNYEYRVVCWGCTQAYSTTTLTTDGVIMCLVSLRDDDYNELTEWWFKSTLVRDGTQSLSFPSPLMYESWGWGSKTESTKKGVELGEYTADGEYWSVRDPDLGDADTFPYVSLYIGINSDANCPTQIFGVHFSYRAISERSDT